MELFNVHSNHGPEYGFREDRCPERRSELLGGEDRLEIVRVYASVALTSLFKVDVPSSSQSIRLGAQATRTETNNHIEGVKVLRPLGLPPGKEFGGGEIL